MVENLNKLTFSGYGRVLRDSLPNRGFPSGAQWQESVQYFSAEGLCFYRQSAGPVYLDFELGMTVLAVRREGETAYFYLDKPVCLPAGREFAILPYQTECSVRLAQPAGAQLEVLEPVTAAENLKLGDRLRVGEIYTLFYREVESGFLFKGEQHSMFELTYVDRGSLHCVVDGNGVELHQGQLMVFGPQQWHMQYTDLDMTARFLTVSFDLESEFAARLPRLFKRAFGLGFDVLPKEGTAGKSSFKITDRDKLKKIFDAFGAEIDGTVSHHINFGVIEDDCCRASFIRGAFLAGGSVTDPEKRYHLELATPHHSVSREAYSVLLELGFTPKETQRGGNWLLYFKQADFIADFFTAIGAPGTAMNIMTAKVEKEMRNTITRRVNCDSANADKVVAAAQEQIDAIRRIVREYGIDALPEPLKDAALLRIANPEASLADLATLSYPPVTKSCLSHRLKKIMSFKPEE